jgi:antitoxin component of MazEF toxin-antitoxin module
MITNMTLESTVNVAKAGTNSLRATLPQGIVSFLNLKPGDKLEWVMDDKNNQRIVTVSKKKMDTRKSLNDAFQFEHLSA